MFTQQETRLTVRHLYHRWHPQIVHDVHQMGPRGARLFVPPYAEPWEPNVDGALVAAAGALGSHVASRLTTLGRTGVVTGAIFDAWTPARAYPHTHGGVRLLSETASARLATPFEVKPEELDGRSAGYDPRVASANFPAPWPGGAWRLADIVETQLQASLAILDHAAAHREHWLRTALEANRRASRAHASPTPSSCPPGSATLRPSRGSWRCCGSARWPWSGPGRRSRRGAGIRRRTPSSCGCSSRRAASRRRSSSGSATRTCGSARGARRSGRTTSPPTRCRCCSASRWTRWARPSRSPSSPSRTRACPRAGWRARAPARPRPRERRPGGPGRLLERGVPVRWALEPFADAGRTFPAGTLLVPASARRLAGAARERARAPGASRPGRPPGAPPAPAAGGPLPLLGPLDGRGLDALRLRAGDGRRVPGAPRSRGAGGTPARALRRDRPARPGAGRIC